MLEQLRQFFSERLDPDDAAREGPPRADRLHLASAALLFEVVRADHAVDDAERERLMEVLAQALALDPDDLETLAELAEAEASDAHDLFQFTRLINERYDDAQKRELVRDMWRVAWADGEVHRYEEQIIRRVADLLYLRHADYIAAKQAGRERDGSPPG